jgi:hypothetical protein
MKEKSATTVALVAVAFCAILDFDSVKAFSEGVSRRQSLQAIIGGVATAVTPAIIPVLPSSALVDEETPRIVTRMGGLLVRCMIGGQF